MSTFYELSDQRSGNVIANYVDECEAWNELRETARKYGAEELNELALMRFEDGQPILVAMDEELVRRALGSMSDPDPKDPLDAPIDSVPDPTTHGLTASKQTVRTGSP